MKNKKLKYQEKNIIKNIKKYLREITIIKRKNGVNMISENIQETIEFCSVMENSLNNGIDIDENVFEHITLILSEIILIVISYNSTEESRRENPDKEKINEYDKKINSLIIESVKELEMTIEILNMWNKFIYKMKSSHQFKLGLLFFIYFSKIHFTRNFNF